MTYTSYQYKKLFNEKIEFTTAFKLLPMKGKMAYEYNPFRNYRLTQDSFFYKGSYLTRELLRERYLLTFENNTWKCNGITLSNTEEQPEFHQSGELVDFITDELLFSLDYPVTMLPQYSYDGSVNLTLIDGKNLPKLINSRWSYTGHNTYEIVDRKGESDTNIYNLGELFNSLTSLYKVYKSIPKIEFKGVVTGGNLKIGNYHFYFKLLDNDGNETVFIGESGLVSVFIGNHTRPNSCTTGQSDQNAFKAVQFLLTNVDNSYNKLIVYYSRYTGQGNENVVPTYHKIDKEFIVKHNGSCSVIITGFEDTEDVSIKDIIDNLNVIDSNKTASICQNRLFLGNVHKHTPDYEELLDLSLRFLPYLGYKPYTYKLDENYNSLSTNKGYYDPINIYNNVGYWGDQIYRIGIVYIFDNNELSPVFPIRGCDSLLVDKDTANNLSSDTNKVKYTQYQDFPVWERDLNDINSLKRKRIKYDELTGNIILDNSITAQLSEEAVLATYENINGVIRFTPDRDANTIYYINIKANFDVINELRKYVKGFFFVRLQRIPTILAQGLTLPVDIESGIPGVPVSLAGGSIFSSVMSNINYTHTKTDDTSGTNAAFEGFVSRYTYTLKLKKSSRFKKFLAIAAAVTVVVAATAASVFTAGASVAGAAAALTALAPALLATAQVALVVTAVGALTAGIANAALNKHYRKHSGDIKILTGEGFDGWKTEIPSGMELKEVDDSRRVIHDFYSRVIFKALKNKDVVSNYAIICPEYEVDLEKFNSIFTGSEFTISPSLAQGLQPSIQADGRYSRFLYDTDRHFYNVGLEDDILNVHAKCKIASIGDGIPLVQLGNTKLRTRSGFGEEAFRYRGILSENYEGWLKKVNSDVVRGAYGPLLLMEYSPFEANTLVNIYIPLYDPLLMQSYFDIRAHDNSPFFAISDRFDIFNLFDNQINQNYSLSGKTEGEELGFAWQVFRGDCYICQFTHRLNRNFNDLSAPYNDDIIDSWCWRNGYDPEDTAKYKKINLGDINAVKMGMWVTFLLRASKNLNIRTLDGSNVSETIMTGHQHGYYPYYPMSVDGGYKHADSYIYNKGFEKSVSERMYFLTPNVPAIKNWFGTRIMYSNILVNDAYKNGFRQFDNTSYKDFTREYGEITKLISLESSLLVVFEHGIGIVPVNGLPGIDENGLEKLVLGELQVLTDVYGSLWPDSIMKVPVNDGQGSSAIVFGVDTVAKKIWRCSLSGFLTISDQKVQEFLNQNIKLKEREISPIIGLRNVKTFYNAFKKDVLFTFYNMTYGVLECVWNLCWNEQMKCFVTFYSWIPSYMENINNIPFSFDRDTSKWIAKLGISHAGNSFADGITLNLNIIGDKDELGINSLSPKSFDWKYINTLGEKRTITVNIPEDRRQNLVGVLSLTNRVVPTGDGVITQIDYELLHDAYQNHRLFKIKEIGSITLLPISTFSLIPDVQSQLALAFDHQLIKLVDYIDNTVIETIPNYNESIYTKDYEEKIYGVYLREDVMMEQLKTELYYRNKKYNSYPDWDDNKYDYYTDGNSDSYFTDVKDMPIFKNRQGKRVALKKNEKLAPVNKEHLVNLLNIRANIWVKFPKSEISSANDHYYESIKGDSVRSGEWINGGYYESTIAVTHQWNLLFLSTDFWKHGQAGIFDIADNIYPCYWYGRQHPFEFEFIVVNSADAHKIFTNMEIIANKAKPDSLHFEVIGEAYAFAPDKKNMYWRQEALKALWQENGADVEYNNNFLKILPKLNPKSADLPHKYYTRRNPLNEIEDYYVSATSPTGKNYLHLSGAEITYYPTRQEFRVWNHLPVVTDDDIILDGVKPLKESPMVLSRINADYQEDKWKMLINPIIVCYKNEYSRKHSNYLFDPKNSDWVDSNRPKLSIFNSPIPDKVYENLKDQDGQMSVPEDLKDIYPPIDGHLNESYVDTTDWLNDVDIYQYDFGSDHNRQEVDVRGTFVKVRVRYSGEEMAIINKIHTMFLLSYV